MTEIDFVMASLVIERLADIAHSYSQMVGVGAAETAGHLISYLAEHPRDAEPLLRFGICELPDDWIVRGSLTYMAQNGEVTHPEKARRARIIKRLERGAGAA